MQARIPHSPSSFRSRTPSPSFLELPAPAQAHAYAAAAEADAVAAPASRSDTPELADRVVPRRAAWGDLSDSEPSPPNVVRFLDNRARGHATDGLGLPVDGSHASFASLHMDEFLEPPPAGGGLGRRMCRPCRPAPLSLLAGVASALFTATVTTLSLRETDAGDDTALQAGIPAGIAAGLAVSALCFLRRRGGPQIHPAAAD